MAAFAQSAPLAHQSTLAGCNGHIDPGVRQALADQPEVEVFVSFDSLYPDRQPSMAELRQTTPQRQARVLATLTPADFTPTFQPKYTSGLFGLVTTAGLQRLACHPDVHAVVVLPVMEAALAESVDLINATDPLANLGVDGTDIDIMVLDSGIDWDHPALEDSFIGEDCLLLAQGGICSDEENSPCYDPNHPANDCLGHGTMVSGVITAAGMGQLSPGVAPSAEIFMYKVLDDTGTTNFIDILAVLEGLYAAGGQVQLPGGGTEDIEFINMSFGASASSVCEMLPNSLEQVFNGLRTDFGIVSFAASQNFADKSAITLPACLPSVVAVGAVFDADIGPHALLAPPVPTTLRKPTR